MSNDPPSFDEKLWFTMGSHCEGKHYLIGNPHTFFGRMWAWCPNKERTFFVSKAEMEDYSVEASYWIQGFLTGNQPEPPYKKDETLTFESVEYQNWLKKVEKFNETGYWED